MGRGPLEVTKAPNGNGKNTVVVREREYPVASWAGLKMISSFLAAVVGVVFAVLTAYYTSEAAQNSRISTQQENITRIDERENERHNSSNDVLTRINDTLDKHQELMQRTNDTLIKVHTTQTHIQLRVEELADDVKQLRKP